MGVISTTQSLPPHGKFEPFRRIVMALHRLEYFREGRPLKALYRLARGPDLRAFVSSTHAGSAQKFLSTHTAVYNTFNVRRHLRLRPRAGYAAVSKYEDAAEVQLSPRPGPQPFQPRTPSRHSAGLQGETLGHVGGMARPCGLIDARHWASYVAPERETVALTMPSAGNHAVILPMSGKKLKFVTDVHALYGRRVRRQHIER